MTIKFKLRRHPIEIKEGLFELFVSDFTYNGRSIDKIILNLSLETSFLIKGGINKSFIIKNVQESEIELNINVLKINSTNVVVEPPRDEFLFAVNQIKQIDGEWEIELAFTHFWNGKKIKKIHLLDDDIKHKKLIEANKSKYLFQLIGIKDDVFSLTNHTNEMLTISKNGFQELNTAVLKQINLEEVFVKDLKTLINHDNNSTYLFNAQKVLASKGLKDYEKIELISSERIDKNEIISFTIPDLQIVLQRDREDKVLRVGRDYHSLVKKIQPELENSVNGLAEKKIQKFLAKYQNENFQKRINFCQTLVKKSSAFLTQIQRQKQKDGTQDDLLENLIKQQDDLFRQLETFVEQTKIQKKVSILKKKFFSTGQNQTEQLYKLRQELKKIDQEFLSIEKKVENYNFLADEYLQHNWFLVLQNDPKLQQLLANYNLSQEKFLDNLNWEEVSPLLQGEDGTLDYYALGELVKKKKSYSASLNDLGYKLTETTPGKEYEKWNQAQVKKSEAVDAISLGYSLEQWKDPQYQEYKNKSRVLADGIIKTLRRKWTLPLTDEQKKTIKNSWSALKLVENIQRIQEEDHLAHAKAYFKNFIDQELKKLSKLEPEELNNLTIYEKEIDKKRGWRELVYYVRRIVKEIKEIHNDKITSIGELKELIKKNISKTLIKSKLRTKELHSRHQNWLSDVEEMGSRSQVTLYERDLVLQLEEINCLLQQKCFPNLDPQIKSQIKQTEDFTSLEEQIKILWAERWKWLITWQINFHLCGYHESQNESSQNYYLQKRILGEVSFLLELLPEETRLRQELSVVFNNFRYLPDIKSLQKEFNIIDSPRSKKIILRKIQNLFQEWAEKSKLSEKAVANWEEVKIKLDLAEQGRVVENLSVLNERQTKLNLLNLPPEVPDENETQAKNGSFEGPSQQFLALFAVSSLILIIFWRWYRKKREEDPFW